MNDRWLTERGMGLLEGALWIVALVPVAVTGLSAMASVHDLNVLSRVPHDVLREVSVSGLRWMPDGNNGRFEADITSLRREITGIAEQALAEAERGVIQAGPVASKACFWIFSVNSSTGWLESPIWSECDTRGSTSREVSLTVPLEAERVGAQGISLGHGKGFADRVVVTGIAVGTDMWRPLEPGRRYHVSRAAISFARQEVML
jgi:hypothetical protein